MSERIDRTTRVTLDAFSGRQNPRWTLSREDADRLQRMIASLDERSAEPEPDGLGYRGFIVESVGTPRLRVVDGRVHEVGRVGSARIDSARDVERFLLTTARAHIDAPVHELVRNTIGRR